VKIFQKIFDVIYAAWVFVVFTFFMLLFLPGLTLPFFFGTRTSWIGYKFLWIWSWVFSVLTRIRYKFYGTENFRKGQSYVYVSNHTSFLDLPGLRLMLPGEFRPLAKKELLKIPVFGWIARGATVIVDRSDRESKHRSLARLKEIIINKGISLLLFVEGTQNRTKEVLQPFKDGAFRLAIETQTPVLPMVVVGAGPLMPPGTVHMKPGLIKIFVAPEISVTEQSDIQSLKQQTFDVMKKMIEQNS